MNREWSDKNKLAQSKLKKTSFQESINDFVELREMLMKELLSWKQVLSLEDYYAISIINADGYHFKTVAYSIWHIISIEDIVVNSLIREKQEIAEFSKKLNIEALYEYALSVKANTDKWLKSLQYEDIKN